MALRLGSFKPHIDGKVIIVNNRINVLNASFMPYFEHYINMYKKLFNGPNNLKFIVLNIFLEPFFIFITNCFQNIIFSTNMFKKLHIYLNIECSSQ